MMIMSERERETVKNKTSRIAEVEDRWTLWLPDGSGYQQNQVVAVSNAEDWRMLIEEENLFWFE